MIKQKFLEETLCKKCNRFAFTLAEVLITLGIIGVVAALTLPVMIANHRIKQYEAGFKKSSSAIMQAGLKTKDTLSINGWNDLKTDDEKKQYIEEFYKNFNVIGEVKNTYDNSSYNCNTYSSNCGFVQCKYFLGGKLLKDGSIIHVTSEGNVCVDTNGYKLPNRAGYDIFVYKIMENTGDIRASRPAKDYDDIYGENDLNWGYQGSNKYCSKGNLDANYANGWHCSYYAMLDVNPDDDTKGYWESLK